MQLTAVVIIALRGISNVIKINKLAIRNCSQPDINPYCSDNTASLKAMYTQAITPITVNTTPEISCRLDFEAKIKIQGSASTICIGLAMRLGTKPEKLNICEKRWKQIQNTQHICNFVMLEVKL